MFDLQPAILKFLKLPPGSPSKNMISKSKQWNKVKMTLRSYLTDLTKVMTFFILRWTFGLNTDNKVLTAFSLVD